MTEQNITKHSFNRKLKCDQCKTISKDVFKSLKFKKNLCLECLKEFMIKQNQLHND